MQLHLDTTHFAVIHSTSIHWGQFLGDEFGSPPIVEFHRLPVERVGSAGRLGNLFLSSWCRKEMSCETLWVPSHAFRLSLTRETARLREFSTVSHAASKTTKGTTTGRHSGPGREWSQAGISCSRGTCTSPYQEWTVCSCRRSSLNIECPVEETSLLQKPFRLLLLKTAIPDYDELTNNVFVK